MAQDHKDISESPAKKPKLENESKKEEIGSCRKDKLKHLQMLEEVQANLELLLQPLSDLETISTSASSINQDGLFYKISNFKSDFAHQSFETDDKNKIPISVTENECSKVDIDKRSSTTPPLELLNFKKENCKSKPNENVQPIPVKISHVPVTSLGRDTNQQHVTKLEITEDAASRNLIDCSIGSKISTMISTRR